MIDTLYNDVQLPKDLRMRRLENVIQYVLTDLQRFILTSIYYEEKTQADLARELGVCPSSIHRALRRAESRVRHYLQY